MSPSVELSPEQQSRLDDWAARLQLLQDKYGYVVGAVRTDRKYKIGEVIPRVRNWKTGMTLDSRTIVVGFSTLEEWKKQNSELNAFPGDDIADSYAQFLKLRADD